MFNVNLGKKVGAAALVILGTMTSANALVLDTFDYELPIFLAGSAGDTTGPIPANEVTNTPNPGDVTYTLTMTGGSNIAFGGSVLADGELKLFNTEGPSDLMLDYNDFDDPAATPIDFTDAGQSTHFYFDIEQVDLNFVLDLTIVDEFFNTASIVYNQATSVASSDPTERVTIGFDDFIGTGVFTNVVRVIATIKSPEAGDIVISEVGTTNVPAPTTLAIFGLGLLGLGLSRRRQA